MSQADAMEIVRECAESRGHTVAEMHQRRRAHWQAGTRADACRRLYAVTELTLKRIANLVGYGDDHTMVVYWTTGRGRERFR